MRTLFAVLILATTSAVPARADMVCIDLSVEQGEPHADVELARLHDHVAPVLGRFPSLARAVQEKRPSLCLSDVMDNAHGYFETEGNRIVISRALSVGLRMGVVLHELRHLWQSVEHACPTDALDMKEYARATFAIEADASAVSLLLAWELKEEGAPEVWEAMAAWPQQADIAESFATAMRETDDKALATTAAFYQWYASEDRRDRYYLASCSDYLDRQDATHLLPRYQMIEPQFFEILCRLPDGRAYDCDDPQAQKAR